MKSLYISRYIVLVALLSSLSAFVAFALTVEELLAEMPARDPAHAASLFAQAAQWDDTQLVALCDRILPFEESSDAEAQLALHGLANYVMGPEGGAYRDKAARLFEETLNRTSHLESRRFFMSPLRVCGDDATVVALAPYLCDAELFDDAIRTLEAISGDAAIGLLANVACDGMPDGFDTAVETALMRMGDTVLVDTDATGLDPLVLAAATSPPGRDDADRVANLCRAALRDHDVAPHARSLALRALVNAQGVTAFPDLIEAAKASEPLVWGTALQLAATMPGEAISRSWVQWLPDLPEQARPQTVYMLGYRDDAASREAVLAALADDDLEMRLAAAETIGRHGGSEALAALERAMSNADSNAEIQTMKQAMLQLPEPDVSRMAAQGALQGDTAQRVAYLEIIAARLADEHLPIVRQCLEDEESRVRRAAMNTLAETGANEDMTLLLDHLLAATAEAEANVARTALIGIADKYDARSDALAHVLKQMEGASMAGRTRLLGVLGAFGDGAALEAVRGIVETALFEEPHDDSLGEAALEALGAWRNADACDLLLDIFGRLDRDEPRMTALRQLINAVSRTIEDEAKQLAVLKKAQAVCRNDAEAQVVTEAVTPLQPDGQE